MFITEFFGKFIRLEDFEFFLAEFLFTSNVLISQSRRGAKFNLLQIK